jgi:hypothetical protein
MARFRLINTSQDRSGFADLKGVIDRQILTAGERRDVIAEIVEAKSPYIDVVQLFDQRCQDCGGKFYGPHPKRFDPCLCPKCLKQDEAYRPNVDPTAKADREGYDYKRFGRGHYTGYW